MQFQDKSSWDDMEHISVTQALLAQRISLTAGRTGDFSTAMASLSFFRRDEPTQPDVCLVEPSVLLVVQGKKQMLLGDDTYIYDAGRFLITSLDLPAKSQVIEASSDRPCLGLMVRLDLRIIAELIAQVGFLPPDDHSASGSMGIGMLTPFMLDPFKRMLELLSEPDAIKVLAPLIEREIHYRLLMSDQAKKLWQIASVGSHGHRIAKAVDWLKLNYAQQLRVDELAARVQMSPSSFHQYFRKLTAMSPVQYQKWLRLNEAKRLMLNESLDAATAAFNVGYESPSQFSREYSRLFGAPPKRSIVQLRRKVSNVSSSGDTVLAK